MVDIFMSFLSVAVNGLYNNDRKNMKNFAKDDYRIRISA